MRQITDSQFSILELLREHGALASGEISYATGRPLASVEDDVQHLRNHAFVVLLSDDRLRLAMLGRRAVEGARVG